MNRFVDLLEKSVIVSSYVAAVTVTATVYLAATGKPVPELLSSVTLIIIGYFFGAGTAKASALAAKK